ncbi:MAG: cofactor-independent phosphoglycerate mutase [Chloroflexi bacterium]|jgi:2,3-bisphosphoglycerate-independent phosphoglycerate mutase|nr:cofactor-independent phosphoglycerate mutase [Chloroflexota bacterium]MBT7081438.1 cofactor-independent phosphoglycerate mutase [Chloroflexota bacterium]MBT7289837.1 cofactor-independent phosphoglycerate mutase [Chloroflexota bacterium]
MKYCILIVDGAADWPIAERDNKTCLELARTPNMDTMATQSLIGMTKTVPDGMEASSACACMSILGYDPITYYRGRAGIEAKSMGIPLYDGEVFFRCNLVNIADGIMKSYSAGAITDNEAHAIMATLQSKLGSDEVQFYPGVSYRNIVKIKAHTETLGAICTPPHDISDQPTASYLPHNSGSQYLLDLMDKAKPILEKHPVNIERTKRGDLPATDIWLFWGSGQSPQMPPFKQQYGLNCAITSGVDLLKGLGKLSSMDILEIPGVKDDGSNDYQAQAAGGIKALDDHDMVIIHVEAPDEAGHEGDLDGKIEAIEKIDQLMVNQLLSYDKDELRVLIMPDHPTPVEIKTHRGDPVPFMIWDSGESNGANRFTEVQAQATGLMVESGYDMMSKLIAR